MGNALVDKLQALDALPKTASASAEASAPSADFATLYAAKKTKADPDQKALDFFLTKEEQHKAAIDKSSTTQDLMVFLDNLNRGLYGTAGALREGIREAKTAGPSLTTLAGIVSPVSLLASTAGRREALRKGVQREERTTARDIAREIAPNILQTIEDNTKFHLFGVDALAMDAASVPLFATDILLDPITYIPFGAPVKLLGKTLGVMGKGMKGAAEVVLGAERVAKVGKAVDTALMEKLYPYVNKRKTWERITTETGQTFDATDLFDTLARAADIADDKATKAGRSVASVGQKTTLLSKIQRYMTADDGTKLGQWQHAMNDEAMQTFDQLYTQRLGIAVEDHATFTTVKDIVDQLGVAASGSAEATTLTHALDAATKEIKTTTAKAITGRLLESRGFKRLANTLSNTEAEASLTVANHRMAQAKTLYRESTATLKDELRTLNTTLRSGIGMTGKMLAQDVDAALRTVRTDGKALVAATKAGVQDVSQLTTQTLDKLKTQISNLTKYQVDVTKGVQGFTKSGVSLRKINALVRNLEIDIGRQQAGLVDTLGAKFSARLQSTMTTLQQEFQHFATQQMAELRGMKGNVTASKQLAAEALTAHKEALSGWVKKQALVERQYRGELLWHELALRKIPRLARQQSQRYHKIFTALNDGKLREQLYQEFATTKTKIFEKGLTQLPEPLREPARIARRLYDEYAAKLSAGDAPLLKGVNPLYAPRIVQKEFLEEISNAIPQFRGVNKGALKRRSFDLYKDSKAYVESQGAKYLEDAPVMAMDYVKKMEMVLAKHTAEQGLLARLGRKELADLPVQLKKDINYLYTNGQTHFNNPVLESVWQNYGKALNTTKMLLTSINAAFSGRNILGFPWLSATTAGLKAGVLFSPVNFADALLLKTGRKGTIRVAGKDLTYDAIREGMEKTGYYGGSFTRGDIHASANLILNRYGWHNPLRWMGALFKFTQHSEDVGRTMALFANLRSGKALPEALAGAEEAMFKYNFINSPVDKALQGLFGFYTFSRRNLPLQFKTLFRDPKQYAITVRALERISHREDLSEEELLTLNGYEKGSFKIFGEAIDGVRQFATLGFFPAEEAYQTTQLLKEGNVQKILGSRLNPVFGAFIDWYTGKNSFYGTEIGNMLPARFTPLITPTMQKALGLTPRQRDKYRGGEKVGTETVLYGSPNVIFMIRQLPTSRFLNDLAVLVSKVAEGKPGQGLLKYATGISVKDLDVEQRKFVQGLSRTQRLRKAAKAKGGKIFERLYVPKTYQPLSPAAAAKERLKALRRSVPEEETP